jgi:ribonucleoside-diphosphate reductase beta chain
MSINSIIKKKGKVENFEPLKITNSIYRVMEEIDVADYLKATEYTEEVLEILELTFGEESSVLEVSAIDDAIEEFLMSNGEHQLAKAYILHRDKKDRNNLPDIFKPRQQYRPYEYPIFQGYIDAIRQSYWTHDEFDFKSDVNDFHVRLSQSQREIVRKCMLAISQVESSVKLFWTKLGDRLPKPEIQECGITMGESEVRHAHAYAELLQLLGLNDEFSKVMDVQCIKNRVKYMQQAISQNTGTDKDYMESILLFSLFIENVSLFSQFYVIMALNKETNMLKGIQNVISSTALEENLHADLGAEIIKILRKEHPEWFTDELNKRVREMVRESYNAEKSIIDWIYSEGDIVEVPKEDVVEFIKNRYNVGLVNAGFEAEFQVDSKFIEKSEWFDVQLKTTTRVDFFSTRSSNYTKLSQSFDPDALF